MNPLREERGLVGKAVIILIVLVAVFGVLAVDLGSVVITRLHVNDAASQAAVDAAAFYKGSQNRQEALQTALTTLQQQDPKIRLTQFAINPTTGEVTLSVKKTAQTFVFRRLDFLKKFTVATATVTQAPPTL